MALRCNKENDLQLREHHIVTTIRDGQERTSNENQGDDDVQKVIIQ